MTTADRVSGIVLLLFSAFVIVQARTLPYWTGDAPGPGFLPFWLGVLLAALSAAVLGRSPGAVTGETTGRGRPKRVAVIVGLTAGAAALALVAGLVVSSGIFTGVTLAYLRPDRRRGNLAAAVLTPLVVWIVFVRWLGVPLPAGPFGF